MEKPVVFQSNGQSVVGILHRPEKRRGRVPAVVFFHGFTGTKVEKHRLFVKMARALANAGIAVLRFDFRGSGDSAGEFSRMTITGELKDARAALRFLRAQAGVDPSRVGVLGLSMGGLVAATILGEDPRIRTAALWGAVSKTEKLVKSRMPPEGRRQLEEMGVVDDRGNAVGRAFLEDLGTHAPLKAIVRTRASVLLVHGGDDQTVPPSSSRAYEKVLRKARKAVVRHVIRGASHTFDSLAWETELIALTLDWFRCTLG